MTNNIIIGDNLTASLVSQCIAIGKAAYGAQPYTQGGTSNNNMAAVILSNVTNQLRALGSTASLGIMTQSVFTIVVNQSNLGLGYSPGKSTLANAMIVQVLNLIGALPSTMQIYLLVGQICNLQAFAATMPDSVAATAASQISGTLSPLQQSQLLSSINQTIQNLGGSSSVTYASFIQSMTNALVNLQLGVTASQLQMIVQGLSNLFYAVYASDTSAAKDWKVNNDSDVINYNDLPQITPHLIFMIEMVLALTGGLQGTLSMGTGGFSQPAPTMLQNVQNSVASSVSSGGVNIPWWLLAVIVIAMVGGIAWYIWANYEA